jgi:hypothetical protein
VIPNNPTGPYQRSELLGRTCTAPAGINVLARTADYIQPPTHTKTNKYQPPPSLFFFFFLLFFFFF